MSGIFERIKGWRWPRPLPGMDMTMADVELLAQCGLATNPTITVYTMVDGVEHRRPANPMARLAASLEKITAAFDEMGVVARRMGDQLAEGLRAVDGSNQ